MRISASNNESFQDIFPNPKCPLLLKSVRQTSNDKVQLGVLLHELSELLERKDYKQEANHQYIIQEQGYSSFIQALSVYSNDSLIVTSCCRCLNSLVSSTSKHSKSLMHKLARSDIFKAIHTVINDFQKRDGDTNRTILTLMLSLTSHAEVIDRIVDAGLLSDSLLISQSRNQRRSIRRQALKIIGSLISHSRSKRKILDKATLQGIIQVIEYEDNDEYIVYHALKLLKLAFEYPEGFGVLSIDSLGINAINRAIEAFPFDQKIVKIASVMLKNLVTQESIEDLVEAIRGEDLTNIACLNSYLLTNDGFDYIVNNIEICDIIGLCANLDTTILESSTVTRHCLASVGRIASASDKYALEAINNGLLTILVETAENGDSKVLSNCLSIVNLLLTNNENVSLIVESEKLGRIINRAVEQNYESRISKAFLRIIGKLNYWECGLKWIEENNYMREVFNVIKNAVNDKEVLEMGLDLVINCCTGDPESLMNFISFTSQVLKKHSKWELVKFYAIKLIEKFCKEYREISKQQNEAIFQILLDVYFVKPQGKFISFEENNDVMDQLETSEVENIEELSKAQHIERDNISKNIISFISDPCLIQKWKQKFDKVAADFIHEQSRFSARVLVPEIKAMRLLMTSPDYYSVKEEVSSLLHSIVVASNVNKRLFDQEIILKEAAGLLLNIVRSLPHENLTHSSDDSSKIVSNILLSAYFILTASVNTSILIDIFSTIETLFRSRLIHPNYIFKGPDHPEESISVEAITGLTVMSILRHPEDHIIVDAGISLITAVVEASPDSVPMMLSHGAANIFPSIFEDLEASSILIEKALKLIRILLSKDQGVYLLSRTKLFEPLLSYVSSRRHVASVLEIARPSLQILSATEPELKTREMQMLLNELLDSLEGEDEEMNLLCLTEMLEQISNLALIDRNIPYLIKNKAPLIFIKQLEREIMKSSSLLRSSGLQRRNIDSCLFALLQLGFSFGSSEASTVDEEFLRLNAIECFISALRLGQDFQQTSYYILKLIEMSTRKEALLQRVVRGALKGNLIPTLINLTEKYSNDQGITNLISCILLRLATSSKSIALQMGQKSFVRLLIKKIKEDLEVFSFGKDDEPCSLPIKSLQYLLIISSANKNTQLLYEEGIMDCAQRLLELKTFTGRNNKFTSGIKNTELNTCIELVLRIVNRLVESRIAGPVEVIISKNFLATLMGSMKSESPAKILVEMLKIVEESVYSSELRQVILEIDCLRCSTNIGLEHLGNELIYSHISVIMEIMKSYLDIAEQTKFVVDLAESLSTGSLDNADAYRNAIMHLIMLVSAKPKEEKFGKGSIALVTLTLIKTLKMPLEDTELGIAQIFLLQKLVKMHDSLRKEVVSSGIVDLIIQRILARTCSSESSWSFKIALDTVWILISGGSCKQTTENALTSKDCVLGDFEIDKENLAQSLIDFTDCMCDKIKNDDNREDWTSLLNTGLTILAYIIEDIDLTGTRISQEQAINTILKFYQTISSQDQFESLINSQIVALQLLKILSKGLQIADLSSVESVVNSILAKFAALKDPTLISNSSKETLLIIEGLNFISDYVSRILIENRELGEKSLKIAIEGMRLLSLERADEKYKYSLLQSLIKIINVLIADHQLLVSFFQLEGNKILGCIINMFAVNTNSIKAIKTKEVVSSDLDINETLEEALRLLQTAIRHKALCKKIFTEDSSLMAILIRISRIYQESSSIITLILDIFQQYLSTVQSNYNLQYKEDTLEAIQSLIENLSVELNNSEEVIQLSEGVENCIKDIRSSFDSEDEQVDKREKLNLQTIEALSGILVNQTAESLESDKFTKEVLDRNIELLYIIEENSKLASQHSASSQTSSSIMQEAIKIILKLLDIPIAATLVQEFNLIGCLMSVVKSHSTSTMLRRSILLVVHKIITSSDFLPTDQYKSVLNNLMAYISYATDQMTRSLTTLEEVENTNTSIHILMAILTHLNLSESHEEAKFVLTLLSELAKAALIDHSLLRSTVDCICRMLDKNSRLIEVLVETETALTLIAHFETFEDDLSLMQALIKFVAKTAHNENLNAIYIEHSILEYLSEVAAQKDCPVAINVELCSAYIALLLGAEGSTIIKADATKFLSDKISELSQDMMLATEMLKLINLITDRDIEVSRSLSTHEAPEWLMLLLVKESAKEKATYLEQILRAINNMLIDEKEVKKYIELGIVDSIVECVDKSSDDIEQISSVLILLKNLLIKADVETLVGINNSHIIESIARISKRNLVSLDLNSTILELYTLFTKGDEKTLIDCIHASGVFKILRTYSFNENTVLKALKTIECIMGARSDGTTALGYERLETLNIVIQSRDCSYRILKSLLRIVNSYSRNLQQCNYLYDSGFILNCLRASSIAALNPHTTLELLRLLLKFAVKDQAAIVTCDESLLEIFNLIKTYAEDRAILETGFSLLSTLVTIKTNATLFMYNNGLEVLKLGIYNEGKIAIHALRIISTLTSNSMIPKKLVIDPELMQTVHQLSTKQIVLQNPRLSSGLKLFLQQVDLQSVSNETAHAKLQKRDLEQSTNILGERNPNLQHTAQRSSRKIQTKDLSRLETQADELKPSHQVHDESTAAKMWLANGTVKNVIMQFIDGEIKFKENSDFSTTNTSVNIAQIIGLQTDSSEFTSLERLREQTRPKDSLYFSILEKLEDGGSKRTNIECLVSSDRLSLMRRTALAAENSRNEDSQTDNYNISQMFKYQF